MRRRYLVLLFSLIAAAAIYLLNASWLAPSQRGKPTFLAHRGVHQTYHRADLKNDTLSTRAHRSDQPFLSGKHAHSMDAAFAAGADIVEFDIHPTTTGDLAVFHDWTL